MSNLLSSATVASRQIAEGPARAAAGGTDGAAGERFAAMLEAMRGGGGIGGEGAGGPVFGAAQAGPSGRGEHKVASAAVSLLLQEVGGDAGAQNVDNAPETSRRRRPAAADVSGEVVDRAVAVGLPSDGRWMATLMAAAPPSPSRDVAA